MKLHAWFSSNSFAVPVLNRRLTSFPLLTDRCKPPNKIPKKWCFKQFYNMCRNGRPNGTSGARYGDAGCQAWMLLEKGWNRPS